MSVKMFSVVDKYASEMLVRSELLGLLKFDPAERIGTMCYPKDPTVATAPFWCKTIRWEFIEKPSCVQSRLFAVQPSSLRIYRCDWEVLRRGERGWSVNLEVVHGYNRSCGRFVPIAQFLETCKETCWGPSERSSKENFVGKISPRGVSRLEIGYDFLYPNISDSNTSILLVKVNAWGVFLVTHAIGPHFPDRSRLSPQPAGVGRTPYYKSLLFIMGWVLLMTHLAPRMFKQSNYRFQSRVGLIEGGVFREKGIS